MKVKVFYTQQIGKIMDIDPKLIEKANRYPYGLHNQEAVDEINNLLGDDCELCGIWTEDETEVLLEV